MIAQVGPMLKLVILSLNQFLMILLGAAAGPCSMAPYNRIAVMEILKPVVIAGDPIQIIQGGHPIGVPIIWRSHVRLGCKRSSARK